MQKLKLEKSFQATPEQLWELIVDPDHYRFWTETFCKGSDFVGDWSEGSKMLFVSDDGTNMENGMFSIVAASQWPEYISLHHIGLLINGAEDCDSPMAKMWTPSYENYRLVKQPNGMCTFDLEQDVPESEITDFRELWSKALDAMEQRLLTTKEMKPMITLRERSPYSTAELWDRLVNPDKVMTWNYASDDWHCPKASNDLKVGGEFHYEMAAKDGSFSFDLWGTYTEIKPESKLYMSLGDGRKLQIDIFKKPYGTLIEERFEAEQENNLHLQRGGWQSILRNLAR